MGAGYPIDHDDDALNSALRTPLAGEDRNPTLQASQYYGDGESSYGYGMSNNGLDDQSHVSAMTAALRQAVSRSKFDGSPNPSSRSRASSTAGSSRRNSATHRPDIDDLAMLKSLSLGDDGGRRSFDSSEDGGYVSDEGTPFDPSGLIFLRRLGEGTGGSVDLVEDPRTGSVMAKKVCGAGDSVRSQLIPGHRAHDESSNAQATTPRAQVLGRLHVAIHCCALRLLSGREGLPDWHLDGVLRGRKSGQLGIEDEEAEYVVFRACAGTHRFLGELAALR